MNGCAGRHGLGWAGWALAAACWASAPGGGGLLAGEVSEERLQATMLWQITKFVEWPEGSGRDSFRVCVLGGGRIRVALEEMAEGQSRGGRPVEIAAIEKAGQAAGCQVVFVAAAAEREVQALLHQTGPPVLTVSGRAGFGRQGGMVSLVRAGSKITIEVNPSAGERAGIRFSSRLLRLARVVQTGGAP